MARLPRLGPAPHRARARPRAPEHRGPRPPPAARGQRRARQRDHAGGRAALRARRRAPHGGRAPRAPGRRPRAPRRRGGDRRPGARGPRRARPPGRHAPRRARRRGRGSPRAAVGAEGPAVHGRYRTVDIRLSELVSALSHALDVTGGQPMGHAERTCLIGQRLADAVGLESAQRSSLFYALLLKDAGCSTTAAADRHDLRQRRPAGQAREPADRRAPPAHGAGLPAAQRRPRRARCASAPAICAPSWR